MSTDYAALADTIKIEDITSDEPNREILHKLKNSDESFDRLYITSNATEKNEYIPIDGEDIGWLGYFVGQNTNLQGLYFYETVKDESFYKEMSCNKYIEKIYISNFGISDGKIFHMLDYFFKNNQNLTTIEMANRCELGEGIRQLTLESLKNFYMCDTDMEDNQLVDIIEAFGINPQLERFQISGMDIGRNKCTALATLLRCSTSELHTLHLSSNNIDDAGLELLVDALANGSNKLQYLILGYNQSITIRGWKTFCCPSRCKKIHW